MTWTHDSISVGQTSVGTAGEVVALTTDPVNVARDWLAFDPCVQF